MYFMQTYIDLGIFRGRELAIGFVLEKNGTRIFRMERNVGRCLPCCDVAVTASAIGKDSYRNDSCANQ